MFVGWREKNVKKKKNVRRIVKEKKRNVKEKKMLEEFFSIQSPS